MTRCEKCTHSFISNETRFCRRYPPGIVIADASGGQTVAFPLVKDEWTCGDRRRWWQFWRR